MAYTPTNWVNDSAPAINATNLNKIETGIDEAHDDLDAATDAATAGELIRRDGSGRAKVTTPSATGDIATKGYVDGLASNYATAAQGSLADSAVQPSTVDAKGDLLVGTADNTVGRLPAGTDGQTIVYDSGEATGMRPADFPSGGGGAIDTDGWRAPLTGANGTRALQGGWLNMAPIVVPQDLDVTEVAFEVTSAGGSPSSVIVGLYSVATPGGAGTLVHTFGEADTTTTGLKQFSGSWEIPAGVYYIAMLSKNNSCTTGATDGRTPGLALCLPTGGEYRTGKRYLSNSGASSLPSTTATPSPNGVVDQAYIPALWVIA